MSEIIQGSMRIGSLSKSELKNLIERDLEVGVNFWDHADIYGNGNSEIAFGEALNEMPGMRNKLKIQTKCSIRNSSFAWYDFSKVHIMNSVEQSLKRLQIETIDYLLLHRPDALVDYEELQDTLQELKNSGKVQKFGVSNQNEAQLKMMNKFVNIPMEVNQLQFSLAHTNIIDAGLYFNTKTTAKQYGDDNTLLYCQSEGVKIQCYSPFQYGVFEGTFINSDKYTALNDVLKRLADKYETTVNGIAVSWIATHPADMDIVIGTTNASRITGIKEGVAIKLLKEEWYELYAAAGNQLP